MAAHHDDGFGRLAAEGEVREAEVALRGQSAVKFHLVRAREFATGGSGEVQEIGDDGLLDLESTIADEEHQTGVRLSDLVGDLHRP